MRIKDISLEKRPRERMEKQGVSVLSDSELLAVILQKGTKEVLKKFDTDAQFRRQQLARGIGTEVANAAKSAANWVGQNQGAVKTAGLVGAGYLGSRLMNRRRQP